MIMKKILLITVLSGFVLLFPDISGAEGGSTGSTAKEDSAVYNPFTPKLPDKKDLPGDSGLPGPGAGQPVVHDVPDLEIPIQGIVWGTDLPQVIIDGKVYIVGDKIEDYEADILDIKKDKIIVLFQGANCIIPRKNNKDKKPIDK